MKISSQEKVFEPVVITIESQDELNWLFACLNTSVSEAESRWDRTYVAVYGKLNEAVQMSMFNAISNLYLESK